MTPLEIINTAIADWNPSTIVCLYSGGYDSLCATHLVHSFGLGLPVLVYSIDTKLSADGWSNYVSAVARQYKWNHHVYDNEKGFNEYKEWVTEYGCPYSDAGHNRAYNRLKDRGIDAILKKHKLHNHDKVLFVSGIRKAESFKRSKLTDPIQRKGEMNAIFANPLFWWTDNDVLNYRVDNDLPDNPFYKTVGGSGDCQCNWGRFITLRKLARHSPVLAAGNVAAIDEISRRYHGYGWDGTPEGQQELIEMDEDEGSVSPFLCSNCSRRKTPGYQEAQEQQYIQAGLF